MKKLFWQNPYQTSLATSVVSIDKPGILFAETIAYSFSGGQESDKAHINDLPVINSEIVENLIFYQLPIGHGFKSGDRVLMTIDWQRRLRLMRLHFAAELILELVTRKLFAGKIGAHIAETKARVDFIYNQNISHIFSDLLTEYDAIITANKPIIVGYSNITPQKRYWEIEGFAKVPCGGTHVKSTSEVGFIELKRVNVGRGKERIEIMLINVN